METNLMGRVVVRALLENAYDLRDVERGLLSADQVRRLEIEDALVDTGATTLSMPKRLIEQLGLSAFVPDAAAPPPGRETSRFIARFA